MRIVMRSFLACFDNYYNDKKQVIALASITVEYCSLYEELCLATACRQKDELVAEYLLQYVVDENK